MRLRSLREQRTALELFLQMWQNFLREQGMPVPSTSDLTHALQEKLLDSSRELFLIESNNQFIGFAEANLEEECNPDEDLPEMCVKVYSFYIKPEERNHMLGSQAFRLLRQWGHDQKAALIETEVSKDLAFSNKFLAEQGLELVGSGPRNVYRGFI